MAQWDVYANSSAASRGEVPYFVDVQSDLLRGVPTRFVMPLMRPGRSLSGLPSRMSPQFEIEGVKLLLVPQEAGPLDSRRLKRPVASLRTESHRIVDALDAVISGV